MSITPEDLDRTEAHLGRSLPDAYRRHLEILGTGAIVSTVDLYVELWSLETIAEVMPERVDRFPYLVPFGGDGSREVLAFDYRTKPPRVVMLDITASDEADVIEQAATFEEFFGSVSTRGLDFGVL